VNKLVAGPHVFIRDECIDVCSDDEQLLRLIEGDEASARRRAIRQPSSASGTLRTSPVQLTMSAQADKAGFAAEHADVRQ
jgi:hypothetical protein